ncbi:hypothetical protein [Pseudomonas aeruginosa]|uniref:hypothetical protein n=1 Tax=Pseudomonas aeruginosa TaxID=287 RepID=UPI0021B39630|nr:hypothetical protein [Pseudomonas aeruginosa]MCT7418583.1 hypothetical protein [Pseudomonas aeruginosa]
MSESRISSSLEVERVISAQLWNESYGKVQAVTNSVMSIFAGALAAKADGRRNQQWLMRIIRIETTGVVHSGNSKAGNEYHMCEAFGHLPGIPYPQRFEYYAAKRMKFACWSL